MSAAEEEQLEAWLDADPRNREEYQAILDLWDRAGDLQGDLEAPAGRRRDRRWWMPLRRMAKARYVAALALLAIGAIFVGGLQLDRLTGPELVAYQTAVGEQRQIVLPDGSDMSLNTNTKVRIEYTPDRRRIVLDYGEAFFDVRRDPARPLTVEVGDRLVTVLGTRFSVYWTGPDVTVAVAEGLVSVYSDEAAESAPASAAGSHDIGRGILLETGTLATFSDESGVVEKEQDRDGIERAHSWRFGYIRFDEEPLYKVLGELNRYTPKRIAIEDSRVLNLPISGVFGLSDTEIVLTSLQAAFPLDVIQRFDGYVIVGREDSETKQ